MCMMYVSTETLVNGLEDLTLVQDDGIFFGHGQQLFTFKSAIRSHIADTILIYWQLFATGIIQIKHNSKKLNIVHTNFDHVFTVTLLWFKVMKNSWSMESTV